MSYQPKTTVITIGVREWTEKTDCSLASSFSAAHAVAVQIALRCQMDIMSLAPFSLGEEGHECNITAVYVNNGRSLTDIRRMMAPEINNNPQSYWMILDLYEWQGMLDCVVTTRGTDEEWK